MDLGNGGGGEAYRNFDKTLHGHGYYDVFMFFFDARSSYDIAAERAVPVCYPNIIVIQFFTEAQGFFDVSVQSKHAYEDTETTDIFYEICGI